MKPRKRTYYSEMSRKAKNICTRSLSKAVVFRRSLTLIRPTYIKSKEKMTDRTLSRSIMKQLTNENRMKTDITSCSASSSTRKSFRWVSVITSGDQLISAEDFNQIIRRKRPEVLVAIFEELHRRNVLEKTMSSRSEAEVASILRFLGRQRF